MIRVEKQIYSFFMLERIIFMPKVASTKTKKSRHMGEGTGKDYIPYITTSEFNSLGTTSVIVDWKTGRGVHCLSQAEAYWYYVLRWDDNNVDIREQYPLDNAITTKLAEENGIRHPHGIMTTDFLVTKADRTYHAYSVKANKSELSDRTLEKLYLEKLYWEAENVPFDLLFKEDLNMTLVQNIKQVVGYYDKNKVFDERSLIKHKIANKIVSLNLENKIDFEILLKNHKENS